MLLAPLPIGYFIRNRIAAYLAYIALHSFVSTFQSTTLLKEWNGGDYSAFVKNPGCGGLVIRPRQPAHLRRVPRPGHARLLAQRQAQAPGPGRGQPRRVTGRFASPAKAITSSWRGRPAAPGSTG